MGGIRMPLDCDNVAVLELLRASGQPPSARLTPAEARGTYMANRALLLPAAKSEAQH